MTPTPERISHERLAGIIGATTFGLRPPEGNPTEPLPRIGEVHAIAHELAQLRAILEPLRKIEAKASKAPWKLWPSYGISPEPHVTLCLDEKGPDTTFVIAARNAIAEMLRLVGDKP